MATDDLPAHASPALQPQRPHRLHPLPDVDADDTAGDDRRPPPPDLLSPAFTPPQTPGTGTPAGERDAAAVLVDADAPAPRLLEALPHVECVVRARIPLTSGQEMFLHLYHNDLDNKEHLAIVFGEHIRSRSLDAARPGETEQDRMIRGAYVGRLHPGRVSSGMGALDAGRASPLLKSLHKPAAAVPPSTTPLGPAAVSHRPSALAAQPSPTTASSSSSSAADAAADAAQLTKPSDPTLPLVRIHSECYTGETVWSARCDCGEQLDEAARLMALPQNKAAGGVIVYLRQEGRGIGLGEKLKAYNLQDLGNDTVEANLLLRHPADARSYGLATAMLVDLGLGNDAGTTAAAAAAARGIRLLTNNPDKVRAVEGPNREVAVRERVAMVPLAWKGGAAGIHSPEVESYLSTKIRKMGHLLASA